MSRALSTKDIADMKQTGEKIATLTAYDASFAQILDEQGVEIILVGDSLGMVIQGADTTLSVNVNDMIYHTKAVSSVCKRALIIADFPFMSYGTPAQALGNAARLVSQGGAHMVKLEGGEAMLETVHQLDSHGIAVCGHLGLTPQSIHKLGGYRVQGRTKDEYEQILKDAKSLQEAGASALVLECVPGALAKEVRQELAIPVIGIGAGPDCDGQVLVLYDMLGLSSLAPKFSRNFLDGSDSVQAAIAAYVNAVKSGEFPGEEHQFS